MEYKREELIALMREMEKQIALCHISPRLAGALADELERSEPVVHGRWVNEQMIIGGFAETWACDCSVCGETQREPLWKPNYCPNCGAHMKDGDG